VIQNCSGWGRISQLMQEEGTREVGAGEPVHYVVDEKA
jgi:hypothetical protein